MMGEMRASRYVHATLTPEGGMLLDTRARGRWHVLTPAAAVCWPHLARGDIEGAARALSQRWATPGQRAYDDALDLANALAAKGLLVPATHPRGRLRCRRSG